MEGGDTRCRQIFDRLQRATEAKKHVGKQVVAEKDDDAYRSKSHTGDKAEKCEIEFAEVYGVAARVDQAYDGAGQDPIALFFEHLATIV